MNWTAKNTGTVLTVCMYDVPAPVVSRIYWASGRMRLEEGGGEGVLVESDIYALLLKDEIWPGSWHV